MRAKIKYIGIYIIIIEKESSNYSINCMYKPVNKQKHKG